MLRLTKFTEKTKMFQNRTILWFQTRTIVWFQTRPMLCYQITVSRKILMDRRNQKVKPPKVRGLVKFKMFYKGFYKYISPA